LSEVITMAYIGLQHSNFDDYLAILANTPINTYLLTYLLTMTYPVTGAIVFTVYMYSCCWRCYDKAEQQRDARSGDVRRGTVSKDGDSRDA